MASQDGTSGSDSLVGTNTDDVLRGLAGDDTLIGLGGNDRLEGGDGQDVLIGGDGNDVLVSGGSPGEFLIGGRGDDLLDGSLANSTGAYGIAVIDAQVADTVFSIFVDPFAGSTIHLSSIDGNDEIRQVASLQFQDKTVASSDVFNIANLYAKYLARQPNAAEYIYWITQPSYPAQGLESALRRDAGVLPVLFDRIVTAYQTTAGRPPSSAEVNAWQKFYVDNTVYSPDSIGYAISNALRSTEALPYFTSLVTLYYQNYMGRAPRPSELTAWKNQAYGYDYGYNYYSGPSYSYEAMRRVIVGSSESQTFLGNQTDQQYQTYVARAATDQEHGNWLGAFSGGATLIDLKTALISLGAAAAGVQSLTGATGAETFSFSSGFASAVIRNYEVAADSISLSSTPFSGVNLFDPAHVHQVASIDAPGTQDLLIDIDTNHYIVLKNVDREQYLAHSTDTIDTIYQRYFGRTTVSTEKIVWDDLFTKGSTYDTLQAALLKATESANTGVLRAAGTAAADTFNYAPATGDLVINGFNAAADAISLRGSAYGGADPLAAHLAKEVPNLSGGTDVLITFGPDNVVLLAGLHLTDLHASNFII